MGLPTKISFLKEITLFYVHTSSISCSVGVNGLFNLIYYTNEKNSHFINNFKI